MLYRTHHPTGPPASKMLHPKPFLNARSCWKAQKQPWHSLISVYTYMYIYLLTCICILHTDIHTQRKTWGKLLACHFLSKLPTFLNTFSDFLRKNTSEKNSNHIDKPETQEFEGNILLALGTQRQELPKKWRKEVLRKAKGRGLCRICMTLHPFCEGRIRQHRTKHKHSCTPAVSASTNRQIFFRLLPSAWLKNGMRHTALMS